MLDQPISLRASDCDYLDRTSIEPWTNRDMLLWFLSNPQHAAPAIDPRMCSIFFRNVWMPFRNPIKNVYTFHHKLQYTQYVYYVIILHLLVVAGDPI